MNSCVSPLAVLPALVRRIVVLSAVGMAMLAVLSAQPQRSFAESPKQNSRALQLNGAHAAEITQTFLKNHYLRRNFDPEIAKAIMDRYLRALDPQRLYLLQPDVNFFRETAPALAIELERGRVDLVRMVHKRFLQRLDERKAFLETLFARPLRPPGNDDIWERDRSKADYAKNEQASNALWATRLRFEFLEQTLRDTSAKAAQEQLQRRYRALHIRHSRENPNGVLSIFLNAFASYYDPHSAYLSPDDLENFNIAMSLSLEGIGATLRWDDGRAVVVSIVPGGAAQRQGVLQAEDIIIGVAEGEKGELEDVTNRRLMEVVKRIRGPRGSIVRLSFLRKDKQLGYARQEILIRRDRIQLKESEAQSSWITHPSLQASKPYRIGVIRLPSFYVDFDGQRARKKNYKSAARDMSKILREFIAQDADGVVLDLRNNGGGSLEEAVAVTSQFLAKGTVVMVKYARGNIARLRGKLDGPIYEGPLVVLVNRYSASASEIVSGALQDYRRAIVVGERSTFGKGTVQNIMELPAGLGALRTTIAQFYRPGGSSTQNRGVEPDIVLPSLNNHLPVGEASLDNPLPWNSIEAARFPKSNLLKAWAPLLMERSQKRIAKVKYFQNERERVQEHLRTRDQQKRISVALLREQTRTTKTNTESTTESANPTPKTNSTSEDPVLQEGIAILGDYISLNGQGKRKSIASGTR